MKKMYALMAIAMFSLSLFAQKGPAWQGIPELDVEGADPREIVYETKNLYEVVKVNNFDIVTQGFDELWDNIPASGVTSFTEIGRRTPTEVTDFACEFKAAYDEFYLYVLLNVTDNNIHEAAIDEIYDGDDDDGNPKYKSASDGVEFMWSTYPVFFKPAFDSGYVVHSVGRWDTTGSYKTGWKLANTESNAIVYDNYVPTWSWDPFGPSETPWAIGWGASAGNFGLESKYNKLSETNYTYFAAIPFETAMAGFTPEVGDTMTMEIKFDDVDESTKDQGIATSTWNSGNNNVYFAMWYAGFFKFSDVEVAPVSTPNVSEVAKLSFYPNPAGDNLILKAEGIQQVDVLNIVGQKVLSAAYNNISEVNLNVSELKSGVYFLSVNGSQTAKFMKK